MRQKHSHIYYIWFSEALKRLGRIVGWLEKLTCWCCFSSIWSSFSSNSCRFSSSWLCCSWICCGQVKWTVNGFNLKGRTDAHWHTETDTPIHRPVIKIRYCDSHAVGYQCKSTCCCSASCRCCFSSCACNCSTKSAYERKSSSVWMQSQVLSVSPVRLSWASLLPALCVWRPFVLGPPETEIETHNLLILSCFYIAVDALQLDRVSIGNRYM